MAKKSAKSDRQAVIDDLRKKQKGADRRRNYMIVGVCAVIAVLILGAAAFPIVKDKLDLREFSGKDLGAIGAAASVCQDEVTKPAEGNQEHRPTGEQISYPDAPPAFGPHWNELNVAPDPMGRKFYTAEDRPELEALVHNLEHGYTILWYDETAADDGDTMNTIQGISRKFTGTTNFRFKFKAVPWTSEDGDPFPDGQHIALSHWSAGGSGTTDAAKQIGVWQYCSAPSGAALQAFMLKYPYTDSPEPNAM